MKIKNLIAKIKIYLSTKWDIFDFIVRVRQIVPNQANPIDVDDITNFTCYRNIEGICVYVPSNFETAFYSDISVCSQEYNIINISRLQDYRTKRNVVSNIYSNINPPSVKIKYIDYIEYKKFPLFIVYTLDLTYDDDLYTNLVNYSKIERRF